MVASNWDKYAIRRIFDIVKKITSILRHIDILDAIRVHSDPVYRTANEASEPIKLLKGTKSHELALKAVGGYPCQSKSALIHD